MSKEKEKILVLCVDRDNDIGVKTGTKTPIIGRTQNLEAASLLAVKDPEESDANAIFGAVKTYDTLQSESADDDYQIATITGSELGGVKADKKLRDQLFEVLNGFPASNVVLVTDGFSDEEVIPIVQSRIPIMSIRRVVVRHSESIEESWALVYRYFKRLTEDPYYARWALGVPGIVLIALASLWYFDRLIYAEIFLLFFIGGIFLVKGFSLDEKLAAMIFPNPPNLVRLLTGTIALVLIGIDIYQTYGVLIDKLPAPSTWLLIMPEVVGYILRYGIDLLVVAIAIFLVGLGVYLYFTRDTRLWWTIVGIVAAVWMRQVSVFASDILLFSQPPAPSEYVLRLLIMIGFGIAITVATIIIAMRLNKRYSQYFREAEAKKEEE